MSQRVMTWEAWIGPLLLAVVGGIVATAPQNKPASRRLDSAGTTLVAQQSDATPSVFARTWEDPLLAVSVQEDKRESEKEKEKAAEPTAAERAAQQKQLSGSVQVDKKDQTKSGEPDKAIVFEVEPQDFDNLKIVLRESFANCAQRIILLAEMSGDSGLEGEESRRTERMAITEAIMACKLKGRRPLEEVGRLRVTSPHRTGIGRNLAYQVMKNDKAGCLVVFVPDQLLGDDQSLGRCVAMAKRLAQAMPEGHAGLHVLVRRRSSTGLIHDLRYASSHPQGNGGLDIRVLSTMSTMSLDQITLNNEEFNKWRTAAQGREAGKGEGMMPRLGCWRIGRVLGPDTPLIAMIVRELDLRRAGLRNPKNAIAVVYEPESPYGEAFAAVLKAQAGDADSRVKRVTFSRGLDAPPLSEQGRNAYREFKDNAEKAGASGLPMSATTPVGPRRTDYVCRQLAAHQKDLSRQNKKLSAVILCAGDTFDKRPLIQLIRERFPDCVIATTDLNAMLTDPSDWRVMRNLVVASHLDLSLGAIQGSASPFRSAYDAALYLGIRHAMHELVADPPTHDEWYTALSQMTPGGRLYEIGRDGPVLLSSEVKRSRSLSPATTGINGAKADGAPPSDRVFYPASGIDLKHGWITESADPSELARRRRSNELLIATVLVELCLLLAVFIMLTGGNQRYLIWIVAGAALAALGLFLVESGGWSSLPPWGPVAVVLATSLGALPRIVMGRKRTGAGVAYPPANQERGGPKPSIVRGFWAVFAGLLSLALIVLVADAVIGRRPWSVINGYFFGLIGLMGTASLAAMSWYILSHGSSGVDKRPEPFALWDEQPRQTKRLPASLRRVRLWIRKQARDPWFVLHRRALWWVALSIGVYAIGRFLLWIGGGLEGEPAGWMNGVSAWPSELVRLAVIGLGAGFLRICLSTHGGLWRQAAGIDDLFQRDARRDVLKTQLGGRLTARPRLTLREVSAVVWKAPVIRATDKLDVGAVLRQLRLRCLFSHSVLRLSLLALLVTSIIMGVIATIGAPNVPVRGGRAYSVHVAMMVGSLAVLNAVVLVIWDGGHLCSRYIGILSHGRSQWPDKFKQAAERLTGVSRKYVDSWLDVRSIGRVTRAINGLIYWPVILILLSAAAWHRGFDAWPFSWLLVVCNGLSLSLCVLAAWTLRRASEAARRGEILHLTQDLADLDRQDELDYEHCIRSRDTIDFQLKFGPNPKKLYLEYLVICRDGMTPQPDRDVDQRSALAIANRISSLIDDVMESTQVRFNPNQSVDMHLNGDGGVYWRQGGTLVRINNAEKRVLREILNTAATDERRIERRAKARAARAEQIKLLIEQIRDVREGAFAPWTEDPVFRGVVVPALGVISVKFADWVNVVVR